MVTPPTQLLSEQLTAAGVLVSGLTISPHADVEDDEIKLTGGYHIQVGQGDYSVVRDEGLVLCYLFSTASIRALVQWCVVNVPQPAAST
jgi:hypothetical protein